MARYLKAGGPPVNGSSRDQAPDHEPVSPFSRTTPAFDLHSHEYLGTWETDAAARAQRARVHRLLERTLGASDLPVLDLGCGPGVDAAWLARRGHRVVAIDASEGMLAVARRQCEGLAVELRRVDLANDPLPEGPFAAAVSNFGALNCTAIAPVAGRLAEQLAPGAPFVLVLVAHRSPIEQIALLASGHPREAVRRRRRDYAEVAGQRIAVHFPRPREVRESVAPWFTVEHAESLGLVLPPPGALGRRLHGLVPWLDPVDATLGALPILRRWGDHVALVLRRTEVRAGVAP